MSNWLGWDRMLQKPPAAAPSATDLPFLPADQSERGVFDEILHSVIAGVREYQADNAAANNAALIRAGNPVRDNTGLIVILLAVAGLYLVLES